jgi:hypothetical protein
MQKQKIFKPEIDRTFDKQLKNQLDSTKVQLDGHKSTIQ